MIRPARPEDLSTIADLVVQLARYERLEHQVSMTPSDLGAHLFGSPRYAEVLLAEETGSAVGFALFFHNYSTFLGRPGIYLEDLFVLPGHRRRGWGRALLAAVANVAVERGCGRFEWAVLRWNEPAIAFYRTLGAIGLEEWQTFRVTGQALTRLAAMAEPEPPSRVCP
jgi:GNAT superfamily N-acetyltransferase